MKKNTRDSLTFSNENSALANAIGRYLARRRRNRIAKRKKAVRDRRSRKAADAGLTASQ